MQSINNKIKESALAFHEKLWPKISKHLGGGRIVHVESVSDSDFFKQVLDAYGGIDAWHIDDDRHLVRGIASRMQRTKRVFKTITIRFRRRSGHATEIDKRMQCLLQPGNWLHPSVLIQGYFAPTEQGYGDVMAVAIARMEDVIKTIVNGKRGTGYANPCDWYCDTTSQKYGNNDATEFAIVPVATLVRHGCKVKWIEF